MAIMLSLLLCGFMLNGSSAPHTIALLHRVSFFSEAYENLVTTEFHNNPNPFYFTAPIDSLPLLRVTGDGVLKQFGYHSSRFGTNLALLFVYAVVCLTITYLCLLLSHPAVRDVLMQVSQGCLPGITLHVFRRSTIFPRCLFWGKQPKLLRMCLTSICRTTGAWTSIKRYSASRRWASSGQATSRTLGRRRFW